MVGSLLPDEKHQGRLGQQAREISEIRDRGSPRQRRSRLVPLMHAVLLLGPIRCRPGKSCMRCTGSPGFTRAWHSVLAVDVVNVIP